MQFEKLWEFSDAASMPNNTSATLGYIDLTTSYYKDFENTQVELWVVIHCNTVPGAGTSIQGAIGIHTSTSVHSGTALVTGRAIARASLSANAKSKGHLIFACPLKSALGCVLDSEYSASSWRYVGPFLTASGDVSTGKVDAYVIPGPPDIPTAMVTTSNIT